jgi:hypothetical protein
MISAAVSFGLLALLPTDFSYPVFGAILFLNGVSMGMFASPNRAGVMNSLPPGDRGAGGGMNQTFQNSAQVLSVGIFFTLMILGLAANLPHTMAAGLEAHGVPAGAAQTAAHLPPVSILFAAFLGYNPIQTLLGPAIHAVPVAQQHVLLGHTFFPSVISHPFSNALASAFAFGLCACAIGALASLIPAKGVRLIVRRSRSGSAARRIPRALGAGSRLPRGGSAAGGPPPGGSSGRCPAAARDPEGSRRASRRP